MGLGSENANKIRSVSNLSNLSMAFLEKWKKKNREQGIGGGSRARGKE